jgi:ABC-type lipoprotein export system ATPase subunit/prefoldin subunit 5
MPAQAASAIEGNAADDAARGARWRRWDLHVHTPASIVQHYGDSQQEAVWNQFLDELEALPAEFSVIGVNDYFSLDGYRKLLTARKQGRLKNIRLLLPVIELRIDVFAGHGTLRKLNLHVVFSEDLDPDVIESFFLRKLNVDLQLDGGSRYRGDIGHADGLIKLGDAVIAATPNDKRDGESPLRVGFRSAAVSMKTVWEALHQTVFDGKHLTALGLSEWGEMKWDGAGAAQKRDAITQVDFVFTACDSSDAYAKGRERLKSDAVNDRLVHASDSHFYSDSAQPNRLGQSLTWIKADPTFRGLRRALRRFEDRVFVGDRPPKLKQVEANRTRFVSGIEIRRNAGAKLDEAWFDCSIPLNEGLVALIGNQGSGKSALADIIALCGNSHTKHFSFLNPSKFCDAKAGKAAAFDAVLHWADGRQTSHRLSDFADPNDVERIRYVPQGFFDAVTNEVDVSEASGFYAEIEKVLFSHIPEDDRLGCRTLKELTEAKTIGISEQVDSLREQISSANRRIVEIEKSITESAVKRAENAVTEKTAEINALRASRPVDVSQPVADPAVLLRLDELRAAEAKFDAEINAFQARVGILKRQETTLTNVRRELNNAADTARKNVEKMQRSLDEAAIPLRASDWLSVALDASPMELALVAITDEIALVAGKLDGAEASGPVAKRQAVIQERSSVQQGMDELSRQHQAYLQAVQEWKTRLTHSEGDPTNPHPQSLFAISAHLETTRTTKPQILRDELVERERLCRALHASLLELGSIQQNLTRWVRTHIEGDALTREHYRLGVDVHLIADQLLDRFFAVVAQKSGTFSGIQDGRDRLKRMLLQCDTGSADEVLTFLNDITAALHFNLRLSPPEQIEPWSQLKKGFEIEEVYDLLFGLNFLSPTFALSLNGKPLRQLSPGERGILLLVFYLLVDQGLEPLIIDQPEGNLNNQSIYEHLVPVFMAAKDRRQILIVTHNPNLAVVCDAEQIIHCSIDHADGCRVTYKSGALENPEFNRLSLDLLEGTEPAFAARDRTYDERKGGQRDKAAD